MSNQRFTRDGSDALEALLENTCRELAAEVERLIPTDRLQALALGGGYGRGEGGVLHTPQGDAPYNDLEFFLLIAGPPRMNENRHGKAIDELGHRMTAKLGIEVEFKISSVESIAAGPTTMFYYDLVEGHRIFGGREDALDACRHHADASRIPPSEAIRLLMNRFTGLLLARERLDQADFSGEDADFTARNIAKAQLAMGDALLAVNGRYHWSCLERHKRLPEVVGESLPKDDLLAFHRDGVDFKLHPRTERSSQEDLATLHARVCEVAWPVWQSIEKKRLGKSFDSPLTYSREGNKCPETCPLKNALLRLRTFGLQGWLGGRPLRYPREALLNTLPILLWEPSADLSLLSRQLVTSVSDRHAAVTAYQHLWEKYN